MKTVTIETYECESCHQRFEGSQECEDHEPDCTRRIDAAFESLAGRRIALHRNGAVHLDPSDEWNGATAIIKLSKAKQRAVIVEVENE